MPSQSLPDFNKMLLVHGRTRIPRFFVKRRKRVCEHLLQDPWLVAHEPERLVRLKGLGFDHRLRYVGSSLTASFSSML